jgi:HTH-type transcriptional regulator, glycine betaine synthesis regulator
VSRDDDSGARDAAVVQIADAVGGLMEAWGFKRNLGRLWTILYLEERPLSAPEVGERLSLSSGAVSMLLTELGQWGAAKKTWIVGERREHYEAETSIWKMVSRVFRERELRWIQNALEQFEAAQAQLASAPAPTTEEAGRAKLITDRVAGLTELARVGAHLLESMLQGEAVDHMPIKKIGELAKLTKGDREP